AVVAQKLSGAAAVIALFQSIAMVGSSHIGPNLRRIAEPHAPADAFATCQGRPARLAGGREPPARRTRTAGYGVNYGLCRGSKTGAGPRCGLSLTAHPRDVGIVASGLPGTA